MGFSKFTGFKANKNQFSGLAKAIVLQVTYTELQFLFNRKKCEGLKSIDKSVILISRAQSVFSVYCTGKFFNTGV
jgi:hypothetical protein